MLEDPWNAPPEDAYAWTAAPAARPSRAGRRDDRVRTRRSVDRRARRRDLVSHLNAIAGAHGVGRIDLIEDRVVGVKSREVYECPGSITLIAAHRALERLVLTRDELRIKARLDQKLCAS